MVKFIVAMLAGNCENTIDMALESVKDADQIIIVYDTTSIDNTNSKIERWVHEFKANITCIGRPYDHSSENKIANSQARNLYLEHLKSSYPNDFCLVIDADEVVEDFSKLRKWVEKYESIFDLYPCCSVKMRHFIGDLGHEDATQLEHFVPHRLFKITNDLIYPDGEHPVLYCIGKEPRNYVCRETTIWHLGYIPNLSYYKERWDNHVNKSTTHTRQFLDNWYISHLLGQYPKSDVNPTDIPAIIWNHFKIDKDMWYFANRGLEAKHFMMAKQWIDYFENSDKIFKVIEFGCGRAPFGYAFNIFVNNSYEGVELSQFAVNNAFIPIKQGDITTYSAGRQYDLVLAIDVLEHLDDNQLNQAMLNLIQHGDNFIFSVPVVGDPNLLNDKTHKQFKTKEEWIALWESYGLKITEAPTDWLYHEQIFIGERK